MKLNILMSVAAILMAGLISSCEKDMNTNSLSDLSTTNYKSTLKVSKTVNLGLAGYFVILSKTGITDVYKSSVVGDAGTNPITGAALLLKCNEVTGTIYTVDAAGPLPCSVINATRLGIAVLNMQAAYSDAAGRSNPDFLNLGAGKFWWKNPYCWFV